MSTEYTEDPAQGFFNYWSGRYPKSAVRMIDLYLTWRENEEFPPLADFENLTSLSTPVSLLDKPLLAQIARSSVTSLTLTMGTGAALPRGCSGSRASSRSPCSAKTSRACPTGSRGCRG